MDLETKAGQLELERKVKQLLLEVGVNPAEAGYKYLADAVHITVEDAAAGREASTIMGLYEDVAALENSTTTAARVERCIRYAIERAFNKRSAGLDAMFRHIEDEKSGKVTNGCFIRTLAMKIYLEI